MQLNPEQLKAISSGETLAFTIDGEEYLVMLQETFDDLRSRVEQIEMRSIFARSVASSDWNDPSMDVYDDYGATEKQLRFFT